MANNCIILTALLTVVASLTAADHNVSIASVAVGGKPWQWTVFIHGTPDALAHVRCVQYSLDPTFPNPHRTVCDRGARDRPFASNGATWAQFSLSATVIFDDKKEQHVQYKLDPQAVEQLPDALSGRWKFNQQKSSGTGGMWRTYSRVGDSVNVSIDKLAGYNLVCDGQVHKNNGQDINCSFNSSGGFQGHQQPPSSYFVDEVSGDTLTISTYSDAAHTKRKVMLIYDRDAPVP